MHSGGQSPPQLLVAVPAKGSPAHLARLREAVQSGAYAPNVDALAERMAGVLTDASHAAFAELSSDAPTILLVEDNDAEAELLDRVLRRSGLVNPCVRVRDGAECLEWLGACAPRELPVAVLLDLRLPKIDGLGVLGSVRENQTLSQLPVLIMTSSRHDEDAVAAESLRIDAFLRKPVHVPSLLEALERAGVSVNAFVSST